jgi:hypothetical protein
MNVLQSKLNHLQQLRQSRNRYTQSIYLEQCREFVEELDAANALCNLEPANRFCCKAMHELYADSQNQIMKQNQVIDDAECRLAQLEKQYADLKNENSIANAEKKELFRRLIIMTLEYHKIYNQFKNLKVDLEDFVLIENKPAAADEKIN